MNNSHYFIPKHNQSPETHIRGRNLSLSLPKQTGCNSPNAQKLSFNFINSSVVPLSYQSKQKHLFLRYSKLKKNRDPTKITQQNIQKYMSLKRKISPFKKIQGQHLTKSPEQSLLTKGRTAKYSVKFLTIPINCPILLKRHLLNSERYSRMKSQPNKRDKINLSQIKKYHIRQKKSSQNQIKPYNQLTFSQIVGNDQDLPNNGHFLNKMNELRSKIQHNLWFGCQSNREQPIKGW